MKLEERIAQLEQENKGLKDKISEQEKAIADKDLEILVLQKLNEILKKASKVDKDTISALRSRLLSEFRSSTEQLYLFDEIENTAVLGALEETPEDAPVEVKAYVRKKARTGIELPSDTPVVDIYDDCVIDTCPRCGSVMKEVGEKVYESFTRITTTAIIRKHVKQFMCTNCEPESGDERIIETPLTGNMLDGTVCDPTLLSQIIENKFSYALPLYRQAQMFSDINLSRFTMDAWLLKVGERLEANMAPCLEKLIYSYPMVNMDETPLLVLGLLGKDGKRKAPHSKTNSFMVVRAATDSKGRHGPVMFSFTDNRRNETIKNLLEPYTGVVQTDGLYGYDNAEKKCSFTHLDCLVHARRKTVEANGKRKEGVAYELLKIYASFFHEEGILKDEYDAGTLTETEYLEKRVKVLLPILNKLKTFCEKYVDKSVGDLHTALNYPIERWDNLIRFLDYPFATSSNQRAENAIRPFTVGRRNWLFNITEFGAQRSAFFYSLVESCKSMNINFQDYMTYVLLNANTIKDGDEEAWTRMLPGNCDISSVKAYRQKILTAKPDPERTEVYKLRGKRV